MARKPWSAHGMDCWMCEIDWTKPHDHVLGVVRCPEGDTETFNALAARVASWHDLEKGEVPKPPAWRWYRWNPDPSGEFSGLLRPAEGPGRGNWMGALVEVARV